MIEQKKRVRDLFQFLREANQLRFRPVRKLEEQPCFVDLSAFPPHPGIQLYRPLQVDGASEVHDILVSVGRPVLSRCPPPPENLTEWLITGWDDPTRETLHADRLNRINQEGTTVTEFFVDDDERVDSLLLWKKQRMDWAEPEILARRAMRFFETFYEIHSAIEKDGEQLELIIADGHLAWKTQSSQDGQITINHPVLLKRVELKFDPNKPEFTIHETDREAELYNGLFVDLNEVAPASLKKRQNELLLSGYHPLGQDDTSAFLKAFIQTVSPLKGEYLYEPAGLNDKPQLWRSPVLILRKRISGIASAIDSIIGDIDQQEMFPSALLQITGSEEGKWTDNGFASTAATTSLIDCYKETVPEDDDILLAKEANDEQVRIIRHLRRSGSVIVQGPPGTGKTHTIANIIGHLLAQGKSVLVTSHTTKALRVLRDKVPDVLQPLCVSVLGSDTDARSQLETSIGAITERLSRGSVSDMLAQAQRIASERIKLLASVRELSHKLRQALENEYREITVHGREFSPSDAARYVAQNKAVHGWIPSRVRPGSQLNITAREVNRLYALGGMFSAEEEQDARRPLPDLATLPEEPIFEMMVSEYSRLTTSDISHGREQWRDDSGLSSTAVAEIVRMLMTEFSDDLRGQQWRPYAIVAGMYGGTAREVWERVLIKIEESCEASAQCALILHHKPKLSDTFPVPRQKQLASEISIHLKNGGKVGILQLLTKSEWRKFINSSSVAAGSPDHRDHFDALYKLANLESARGELASLWDSLVGRITGTSFSNLGQSPELACRAIIPEIRRCLDWHGKSWLPLVKRLKSEGLKLDEIIASLPRETSPTADYLLIERLAVNVLPLILEAEMARRRLKECEEGFQILTDLASKIDAEFLDRGSVGRILSAVRSRDIAGYAAALGYVRRLRMLRPLVEERFRLIEKLGHVAPGWAGQIASRVFPHDSATVPGDVNSAWTWRQLHDELRERDKLDARELQHRIDKTRAMLRELTLSLIDNLAWGKQIEWLQNNNAVRQALVLWLDTSKRLAHTRQPSTRQMLLTEARNLMKQCAKAVPVWVMPIAIMAESFDPKTTRFDVVIIDEASQADLNALIPLYMAKQVIIVGDHEQVTPLGVGKDQIVLANLRQSLLQDIPGAHLYDNISSIYDIARHSFGDTIRLAEHFRCVPEIIAFSNQLSYNGTIRPLRETNSSNLKPACIPYRVRGIRENDTNSIEAETIVSLIEAMIKHPAYKDKTIGVISMLKESQAIKIETLLHKRIDIVEIQKRRIQAGISAQFQGDERDVIILSFVASQGNDGYMRAMGEGAFELVKKRFNVATSRARDQLWAVHSFDPDRHLKADDMRLKLLQHMKEPWASVNAYSNEAGKADSDFERQVLKRLTDAGYRVKAQWQVGYYRIDLVVEGDGKRLAVECDGDRYHPIEKLEDDIARQTVLERLGWEFVRIRGTAFYRSPEDALKPVFERLAELGIPAAGESREELIEDRTLLYELEDIIAAASESADEAEPQNRFREDIRHDSRDVFDDMDVSAIPHDCDLTGIVRAIGGKAHIESVLRHWAHVKGYKRIGKNIKLAFYNELIAHEQQGIIGVSGDTVSLL